MEGLLIGLIIIVVLVNIRATILTFQYKRKKTQLTEDTDAIYQSMEEFVSNLEKENNELYQNIVDYIKQKENKLDERIRKLEEKLETEVIDTPTMEEYSRDNQDEQQPTESEVDHSNDNNQVFERISQLYKQGFSPKQIAKVLQMDHGEVELIVNMFKSKQSYHK